MSKRSIEEMGTEANEHFRQAEEQRKTLSDRVERERDQLENKHDQMLNDALGMADKITAASREKGTNIRLKLEKGPQKYGTDHVVSAAGVVQTDDFDGHGDGT